MQILIDAAKLARTRAFAPYSKFAVGAALQTVNGEIIYGCNVENMSYGLTNCAERTALFSAIAQGIALQDIIALAVIADTHTPISPCGACRQVMVELLASDTTLILSNLKGDIIYTTPSALLPGAFNLDQDRILSHNV